MITYRWVIRPGARFVAAYHTFCSHLAMRGAPARAVQELAGRSELGMTWRYMHLSPTALESAIELLERRGNIVATPGVEISKSSV
jgi:hypothetical protein